MKFVAQLRQIFSRQWLGIYTGQWACMLLQFVLFMSWMENAAFYYDDGVWLQRVQYFCSQGWNSLLQLFPWGPGRSSYRHPYVAALLHSLSYHIYPSVFSVLVGVAISHAVAWAAVLRVANAMNRPLLGWLFTLQYFWTPSMAAYYGLRIWQAVYLPVAATFFAVFCLRYSVTLQRRYIFLMAVMASVCVLFHASAASLFAVPIVLYWNQSHRISSRQYWIAIAVCGAVLAPWWVPLLYKSERVLYFLPLAAAAVWALRFTGPLKNLGLVLIPALGVWLCAGVFGKTSIRLFELFGDILAAPSTWVAGKLALPLSGWQSNWLSVSLWIWAMALASLIFLWGRKRTIAPTECTLVLLNVLPLVLLSVLQIFHRIGPHHYCIALMPGAWLLISWFIVDKWQQSRLFGSGLAVILVAQLVGSVWMHQRHLSQTGGIGARCSTLGEKQAVIAYLCDQSLGQVRLVPPDDTFNSCSYRQTWSPLIRESGCKKFSDFSKTPQASIGYLWEPHVRPAMHPWGNDGEVIEALRQTAEMRSFRSVRLRMANQALQVGPIIHLTKP
jgi:hypothetical protein